MKGGFDLGGLCPGGLCPYGTIRWRASIVNVSSDESMFAVRIRYELHGPLSYRTKQM